MFPHKIFKTLYIGVINLYYYIHFLYSSLKKGKTPYKIEYWKYYTFFFAYLRDIPLSFKHFDVLLS